MWEIGSLESSLAFRGWWELRFSAKAKRENGERAMLDGVCVWRDLFSRGHPLGLSVLQKSSKRRLKTISLGFVNQEVTRTLMRAVSVEIASRD